MRIKQKRAVNPFLTAPPAGAAPVIRTTTDQADHPVFGAAISIAGASVPLQIPAPDLPAPTVTHDLTPGALHVVGVHGGAGATSLTHLLGDTAVDTRGLVPADPGSVIRPRVLFVARTHGAGLAAARLAATQWAAGLLPIDLVGLALVADAPRLAKPLRPEVETVTRLTPRCWLIPWRQDWHELPQPRGDASGRMRRALSEIRAAATLS